MTIYLACTVRGSRAAVSLLRQLCDRLEASGHRVLTRHLLDDDVDRAESVLSERDVYARDLEWLDACDVLIADASGSSYGVGFEVGYVLGCSARTAQRVLLVYHRDRGPVISRLIVGNAHPRCRTHAYAGVEDLVAFVESNIGGEGRAAGP